MSHIAWRDNPDIPEVTEQQLAQLQDLAERVDASAARAYCADECDRRTCTGWERHMFGVDSTTAFAWALGKGYLRLPEVYAPGGLRPASGEITLEAPDGTHWFRMGGRERFDQIGGPGVARNFDSLVKRFQRLEEVPRR